MISFNTIRAKCLAFLRSVRFAIGFIYKAYPLGAFLLPLIALISGPLPAIYFYLIKRVVDGVELAMHGEWVPGRTVIISSVSFAFGIAVFQHGLSRLNEYMEELVRKRLNHYIDRHIIERAVILDLEYFETPSFYDKLNRAQQDAGIRSYTILNSLIQGITSLVTLASLLAILVTLAWWIIPAILILISPSLFVQIRLSRLKWLTLRKITADRRRMYYYQNLLNSPETAKEVRLFHLSGYMLNLWEEAFNKIYNTDRDLSIRAYLAIFGTLLLQTIAIFSVFMFAIYRTIISGISTIGSLVMYLQVTERITGVTINLFRALATLQESNLYLANLFEFMEQKPRIVAPANPHPTPSFIQHGIVFDAIDFTYPGTDKPVIRGLTLEIRAGERVALVGENGVGKTTLIKLLTRLYDPQNGAIRVDGIDLRDLDPIAWQRLIGVIFQDFVHYAMTLRENIGFGQIDRIDDLHRIRVAAELSGADKLASRLNNSWETQLGRTFDEGQELSIGQWQKIALARAFFREAQVLILDEPTASLDAKQEYETFNKFNELTKGMTTILISHRFSSVRMVDRIIVIEDGRIVESGSHEQLLSLNGQYADLFKRQSSGYR